MQGAAAKSTPQAEIKTLLYKLPTLDEKGQIDAYKQMYQISMNGMSLHDQYYYLGLWYKEALRQKDIKAEAEVLDTKFKLYYNNNINEALLKQAPAAIEYLRKNKQEEYYFDIWDMMINTYLYLGKPNTAMSEVKKMMQEATRINYITGLGIARNNMGNVYLNMGYAAEAIYSYEKSMELLTKVDDEASSDITINVFAAYTDALYGQKDFAAMKQVNKKWRLYMDEYYNKHSNAKYNPKYDYWESYYYISCMKTAIGLREIKKALQLEKMAEAITPRGSGWGDKALEFYKTELLILQGNYGMALALNDKRMRENQNLNDLKAYITVRQQRVKIMKHLGRYKEATELLERVNELNDSINVQSSRNQLGELNTLFHLNELKIQQKLDNSKVIIICTGIVLVILLIIVFYIGYIQRRLRDKNKQLVIARDQAQETNRMKTEFIHGISHQIRTPLNMIVGYANLVTSPTAPLGPADAVKANRIIRKNTEQITELVNSMLALSENQNSKSLDRKDTIACNELCRKAIANSHIEENEKIHFSYYSQVPEELEMMTDKDSAIIAIVNVLDNAMKFSKDEGTVRMQVSADNQLLYIKIEDTGIGISEEDSDRIFERFVKLNEFQKGFGVGLSMGRETAIQLGGNIILDKTYHEGARFIITLAL